MLKRAWYQGSDPVRRNSEIFVFSVLPRLESTWNEMVFEKLNATMLHSYSGVFRYVRVQIIHIVFKLFGNFPQTNRTNKKDIENVCVKVKKTSTFSWKEIWFLYSRTTETRKLVLTVCFVIYVSFALRREPRRFLHRSRSHARVNSNDNYINLHSSASFLFTCSHIIHVYSVCNLNNKS